ncbi:pilus assembly protein N-terminal domain-containing protein [Geomonas paludis]|uniref:Pilus assembly protein CpaC n=1 Tax=Geomonas paludis TaxID=2740185 RepID=A0A6V8MX94_9BACT|nr:pilus assembly protein N-terminal domain-containing protein [Geomonas paludis]UPU34466.1 pilus assembly protein N-terminal domain-containing protein [Geomonas paludis]GFO64454.1 pilus assembly protein CpaC [Geomonas paludis]
MKPFTTGKNACLLLILLVVILPMSSLAAVPTEVVVNRSVLLNLNTKSERVSIAAPQVAELVIISPTQLEIIGRKVGATTLIVWEAGGKSTFFDVRVKRDVSVIESQMELLQDQIQDIAPNDTIKVDYANDTIVLSGKAANEQTVAKAVELARAYAVKGDTAGEKIPSAESGLDTSAPPYQYVDNRNEKETSRPPGGNQTAVTVLNHVEIDEPQQVVLEVKVAQVDKSALKSLGISAFVRGNSAEGFSNLVGAPSGQLTVRNPDGSIRSQATGIAGPVPGLASFNPLDQYQLGVSLFDAGVGAVLRALVSKNLAKVLAEPNLMVQSGQAGKFLAGSRIPFSYVSGVGALSSTSIQFIDVGVKLNFRPEVLENGLISLRIEPAEVSSITGVLAVNGYPIIDTREVRTRVKLRNGESLILAGLLQEEAIKAMSKIPILGDIPILGALFRSTQDDIKEKELVFFITPRLAMANAPGSKIPLPTDKPLTPEQEKEFQWIPLPK